jgi:hypothetical protein
MTWSASNELTHTEEKCMMIDDDNQNTNKAVEVVVSEIRRKEAIVSKTVTPSNFKGKTNAI